MSGGWIQDKSGVWTYYPPQEGVNVAKRNKRKITKEFKRNAAPEKLMVARASPPEWDAMTNENGHPFTVAKVTPQTVMLNRESFLGRSAAILAAHQSDVESVKDILEFGKTAKDYTDIVSEVNKNTVNMRMPGGTAVYDRNMMQPFRWNPNPNYNPKATYGDSQMFDPDKVHSISIGNNVSRFLKFTGGTIDVVDKGVTVFDVINTAVKDGTSDQKFQKKVAVESTKAAVGAGVDRCMTLWPWGTLLCGTGKVIGVDEKIGDRVGQRVENVATENSNQAKRKAELEQWAQRNRVSVEHAQRYFAQKYPDYDKLPNNRPYLTIEDVLFTPASDQEKYIIPPNENNKTPLLIDDAPTENQ